MSSVTTKVGDKGNTRLWSGEEVRKTDDRVVLCGHIDELVSVLGLAYVNTRNVELGPANAIKCIQKDLFIVASEVATTYPKYNNLKDKIGPKEVAKLTDDCKLLEKNIELPKGFILPGARVDSAYLDLARTVTRRVERGYVGLFDSCKVDNKCVIIWLNRLSDYLYLLARYLENNNYNMVKE